MMKRLLPSMILLALTLLLGPVQAVASPRAWETLKTERSDARSVARETDIEVKTAPGAVIISTNIRTQVKVYTILGQLVSSETIGPGTVQLRVAAHGVYIVKVGSLTCKVAL